MVQNMKSSSGKRKFQKYFINISYKDAGKLASVRHSCVEELEYKLKLPVSPKYTSNIGEGVKEQLNKMLFLYEEKLKGVPLAFDKIKIVNSEIIDDQEFINLNISASFIVFKPKISKILYGVVTRISKFVNTSTGLFL